MNDVDRLLARAQVGLAFLTATAFIACLGSLLWLLLVPYGSNQPSQTALTLLTALLATFGTIFTMQQQYFFSRQRPPSLPPPNGASNVQPTTTGITVTPAGPK